MVTAIKYFGQKEKLNIPLTSPDVDPNRLNYLESLSHLDGVIEVWEDYLDSTNPRFKNLFPNAIFQPIPKIVLQDFAVDLDFISKMKGFNVQQKLFLLSTMSFDWKQAWYLDAIDFPAFWDDESNWIFPQDLADIVISFMQNLGDKYNDTEDVDVALQVLKNTKDSFYSELQKMKELRAKITSVESEKLKFWLAFQNLALTGYMEVIELMIEFFLYCKENKSLPSEPFI